MKRFAALFMSLCLIVGLGAGCNSSSSTGSGKVTIDSVSLPKKLDGNKIRIMAYDGWEDEHGEIRKMLKEWYGAEVEYIVVDWKEQKNKLAVDLAANITYDMVPVGPDLALNNLCTPVNDYFNLDEEIFSKYKSVANSMTFDGKLYGVPSVPNMEVIIYNKTLIENLGYETPLESLKAGNWNWDTFKKLSSGLAKEKTAGGEKITGFSSWDNMLFLTANDTGFMKWDNGKFALNLDDTKLREALNFCKELSATGGFTGWQGWSQSDFQLGNTAMIMDRFGNKTHFVSDLSFEWDFVPVPTGYSGSGNMAPGTVAVYGVPEGSTNPSGGAAYIYLFCKQDYEKRKEYLKGYLSAEQIERFESLYPKITRDFHSVAISAEEDTFMWDIFGGADVTATLESYKTKWQGTVDNYVAGLPK